ncbi:acyl-CoA synthetase family member 2 isoform X2 [Rhodnius prolixus]|uniref:acyl-CoA synthetase family member 2 isoform X2 n=1 Tax=Rhodnius prolixus TaxID=13249 RepID=UPI003D18988C
MASNGPSSGGLSYYNNPGQEPLRAITVGQLVDHAAYTWPERRALVSMHENITVTYAELRQQANRLAASLLALGLRPGDRLAILGPNSVHWCVTMLAAAKAGLVLVTLNPAYRTTELKYSLNEVGVKAIITDETFKSQNYYDMLMEIDPELLTQPSGCKVKSRIVPELERIVVKTDKMLSGAYRFIDVVEMADNENHLYDVSRSIQPDDPVSIQYSSGTTGFPKAATLTHFGIINNGHFAGKRCDYSMMHHTLCVQVPLFHIFGCVLGVITGIDYGVTMVFPGPSFKAETSLAAIKKEEFTAIYGTPTMYTDLLAAIKSTEYNAELQKGLNKFKIIVSGGAVCSPKLFTDMAETFHCTNVQSFYGMSETSPIMFTNTSEDTFEQRTSTVGRVAEHSEVKIVDSNGKMVPFGTPGEAWFRGYATMLKYWGDEEKTREIMTPCKWLKSGDVMVLSADGYGKIVGRIKDIVIRGGENIFPSEVEHFLHLHPDITEVYVYGVSDERMGEEVCASIKLSPGSSISADDVKNYCKGKIAHFKIPTFIKFVDDFPKTASGKVQKHVLRSMMEKDLKNNRS